MGTFIAANPGLTFLLICFLFATVVAVSSVIGKTWEMATREREKTKRVELKTAARRAEAEAQALAAWTPPFERKPVDD
jgi:hypothetical protein